jgi:hypothetical protein
LAADFAREALSLSSKDLGLGTREGPWANRRLTDLLEEATVGQGPAGDWPAASWSEERLIKRAAQENDPGRKTALALGCILSVLARGAFPAEPYYTFDTLGPGFRDRHPVNLASVAGFVRQREAEAAADVTAALLKEKVLFQHLRVAMRKLRYQLQATFKFVVEDGHFVWVEDFEPTFTSPRLRQAFRFLRDLGLARGRAEGWGLTADGRALLGQPDGR